MRMPFFVAAAAMLISAGALACDYPDVSVERMPNGAEADMDEMLEAQAQVQEYVEAMEGFIECVDDKLANEYSDLDAVEELDETERERARVMLQRRDAAVDQLQDVAEAFNEQVRLYQESQEG